MHFNIRLLTIFYLGCLFIFSLSSVTAMEGNDSVSAFFRSRPLSEKTLREAEQEKNKPLKSPRNLREDTKKKEVAEKKTHTPLSSPRNLRKDTKKKEVAEKKTHTLLSSPRNLRDDTKKQEAVTDILSASEFVRTLHFSNETLREEEAKKNKLSSSLSTVGDHRHILPEVIINRAEKELRIMTTHTDQRFVEDFFVPYLITRVQKKP